MLSRILIYVRAEVSTKYQEDKSHLHTSVTERMGCTDGNTIHVNGRVCLFLAPAAAEAEHIAQGNAMECDDRCWGDFRQIFELDMDA